MLWLVSGWRDRDRGKGQLDVQVGRNILVTAPAGGFEQKCRRGGRDSSSAQMV